MVARVLPKSEWQSFCDGISKGVASKLAQIEVTGLTLGDQITANWLPLLGITYEPKSDLLEIALEGLDHLIHNPREISVEASPEGLTSMEIVDSARQRQIVKLKEPLMLPAYSK
jgi:hypothetical protein